MNLNGKTESFRFSLWKYKKLVVDYDIKKPEMASVITDLKWPLTSTFQDI